MCASLPTALTLEVSDPHPTQLQAARGPCCLSAPRGPECWRWRLVPSRLRSPLVQVPSGASRACPEMLTPACVPQATAHVLTASQRGDSCPRAPCLPAPTHRAPAERPLCGAGGGGISGCWVCWPLRPFSPRHWLHSRLRMWHWP